MPTSSSTAAPPRAPEAQAPGTELESATDLFERFRADRGEAAFRQLFRAVQPALLRLACRLAAGDRGEAEELVQEAWIRVVERLERFRGEASVLTWMSGIVVRCAWERRRERARLEPLAADVQAPIEPRLDGSDLSRGVARLPPGCREVLVLHDLEGYTHQEIGALLGLEPGTSKSQLHRARRLLRSWLEPREIGST